METITGIYKIQSIIHPERCYIGSTVNIKNRWQHHISKLRNEKHHSPILQAHYDKYGLEDLQFSIIEECPENLLEERENYYINLFQFENTGKPYLNVNKYAGVTFPCTEERKAKLRGNQNAKGHKISEEVLDKFFRIPMTEEHKQACRHPHKKFSEEYKATLKGRIPWNKGLSKETDERVLAQSKTQTGLPNPMKGRKHTVPSPLKGKSNGRKGIACPNLKGLINGNTNASGKRSPEFREACKQHKMPDNKGRKLDRATNTYYIP